jgi:hypothetical protein
VSERKTLAKEERKRTAHLHMLVVHDHSYMPLQWMVERVPEAVVMKAYRCIVGAGNRPNNKVNSEQSQSCCITSKFAFQVPAKQEGCG